MAEDKRTRDARVADLDDGNSILIIKSEFDLLLLGFNQNKCVFSKIIDFENEDLPRGMGAMKLGNNMFFVFGGRRVSPNSKFDTIKKTVYKLVHDNDDWSLKLTKEVNEPSASKILPRVEDVNGNIFVIQDIFRFCRWDKPQPLLEAYDKNSNTWNDFQTLHCWSNEEEAILKSGRICHSFSVGCRLYIGVTDQEKRQYFFCFDTSMSRWEAESASNLWNSFKNCHVNLPFSAVCVSGIDNLDANLNVILYKERDTMLAYLIDDTGSLLFYQNLTLELYKNREKITDCFGESLINHKSGGGRMCLVTKFPDVGEDEWAILIRDFELKVKQGVKEKLQELSAYGTYPVNREMEFLALHIYNNQRFSIIDPDGSRFGLRDAFFL